MESCGVGQGLDCGAVGGSSGTIKVFCSLAGLEKQKAGAWMDSRWGRLLDIFI